MEVPFPRRLFLDSGVVQLYFDYGEYIFDGGEVPATARIRRMPEGMANLDGLKASRDGQPTQCLRVGGIR
jgi:hypothetical protein